jgi:TPR repeat protein
VPAQYELAVRYQNGNGVERNDAESVRWLQEAARLGNGDAQFELGNAYLKGRGVAQDPVAAYACYVLAGANGNAASEQALKSMTATLTSSQIAQVRATVAEMYLQGRGTPQDSVAAYTWFTLAESAGSADSGSAKRALAGKMSKAQIAAARRHASEWLKDHGEQSR